jgi:hypothetical protein
MFPSANTTEAENALRRELRPRERLLWSGMPKQGFVFRGIDAFIVPFMLLWMALPGFELVEALASGRQSFLMIIYPFILLVGLYFLVGRHIVDAKMRSRTFYGVTNTRVLLLSGLWNRRTASLDLAGRYDITLTESRGRRGSILFGSDEWPGATMYGYGLPWMTRYMAPRFDLIADARRVYDLILRAQVGEA